MNSKSFVAETLLTSYVPLYPLSINPVVFVESVTFLIVTESPTFKLWGSSARTVTVFETLEQVLIKLGFRL